MAASLTYVCLPHFDFMNTWKVIEHLKTAVVLPKRQHSKVFFDQWSTKQTHVCIHPYRTNICTCGCIWTDNIDSINIFIKKEKMKTCTYMRNVGVSGNGYVCLMYVCENILIKKGIYAHVRKHMYENIYVYKKSMLNICPYTQIYLSTYLFRFSLPPYVPSYLPTRLSVSTNIFYTSQESTY